MHKTILLAATLFFSLITTTFGAANKNFTLSNVTASVGTNARNGQYVVYGNWTESANQAVWLCLGDVADPLAKARYATVLAAMSTGKNIWISYWTSNTSTNFEAYVDDTGEMWTCRIVN